MSQGPRTVGQDHQKVKKPHIRPRKEEKQLDKCQKIAGVKAPIARANEAPAVRSELYYVFLPS